MIQKTNNSYFARELNFKNGEKIIRICSCM